MTIPATILSDEQLRRIRDNMPVLSNRPDGVVDLGRLLNDFSALVKTDVEALEASVGAIGDPNAELAKIVSGSATILNGGTSVVVAVGAAFDGKFAVVSMAEAPTAAGLVWAGPVAGGNLTINSDVDNTADLDVHYFLDGR